MTTQFNTLNNVSTTQKDNLTQKFNSATAEIDILKAAPPTAPNTKYTTIPDLMRALKDISTPYMEKYKQFSVTADATIKALNDQKIGAEASIVTALESEVATLKKAQANLRNTFIETVAEQRLALLMHENNYSLALGCGANNHIYATEDDAEIKAAFHQSQSLNEAMKGSKVLLTQRWNPFLKTNDGIGPFGGLLEMANKVFTTFIFSADEFNSATTAIADNIKKTLQPISDRVSKSHLSPSEQDTSNRIQFLLDILDQQKTGEERKKLEDQIGKYWDDLRFNDNGEIYRVTNINEVAFNGANRETLEESDVVGSDLQNQLYTMLSSKETRDILLGGELPGRKMSKITDPNFILRIFGITDNKEVAQFVMPVMMATKVELSKLAEFQAHYENRGDQKILNPTSHFEVKELLFNNLNELRRHSGQDYEDSLGVAVTKNLPVYGNYAYRYDHESLIPWILSFKIAHMLTKDDTTAFRTSILKMVKQDQRDVFKVDGKEHKLNMLVKAKMMFAADLKALTGADQTLKAYELLEHEITGHSTELKDFVTADFLEVMDYTAGTEYVKMLGAEIDAACTIS